MNIKLNEYLDQLIENIYPKHKLDMLRDDLKLIKNVDIEESDLMIIHKKLQHLKFPEFFHTDYDLMIVLLERYNNRISVPWYFLDKFLKKYDELEKNLNELEELINRDKNDIHLLRDQQIIIIANLYRFFNGKEYNPIRLIIKYYEIVNDADEEITRRFYESLKKNSDDKLNLAYQMRRVINKIIFEDHEE